MNQFVHTQFKHLHSIPELAFEEEKTSAYLAQKLEEFGYKVTRNIGTTGVVGVLDSNNDGTFFALRADMDALPYLVDGKNVAIHACGHDANCSMVLAAAKIAAEKGIKSGKLAILFQQGEECVGAIGMAESEKMPKIEEMVSLHLRPKEEAVLGQAVSGLLHSASRFVEIMIKGKASHGARAFLGVNAIDIATSIIQATNAIKENPAFSYSIKATQIETVGNSKNTVPDKCRLVFDIRSETNETVESLLVKLENICNSTAQAYGGEIESFSHDGVLAAVLDSGLTALCDTAIKEVIGESLGVKKTAGGEDIYYFNKICGIKIGYLGLGADVKHGLHHQEMSFNEDVLDIGVNVLEKVIDLKLGFKE